MDRRMFLRNAALLLATGVAVDQLELLERLQWEPKRLWTGWTPPLAPVSIAALNDLFKKVNANLRDALQLQAPEYAWLRKVS